MEQMSKAKKIMIALLVVLTVIVILQNTKAVDTKLLFVTVTMPRALLLLVTFLGGLAMGFVLSDFRLKKTQNEK
jgi:uncharacterized integral membrane protein